MIHCVLPVFDLLMPTLCLERAMPSHRRSAERHFLISMNTFE